MLAYKKNNGYKLKTFFKFQNLILFVIFITALASFLAIYFVLKNISTQFNEYNSNIKNLASTVAAFDKNFEQKAARLSGAELLLNNTNKILSTVYYGTADSNEREEVKNFTAFSLTYKEKFYLITAGHCIEMDGLRYKNFKFKSNKADTWITPELIDYKSDYENNIDYAIFYSPYIDMGLIPAESNEDMTALYVLGNLERGLNLVKGYKDAKEGESGSPILDAKCHVTGILIKKGGAFTPIRVVIEALEMLQKD